MKLNMLANNLGAKKNKKRLGRGIGSGKGKTCGRGVKGQKSRSGVAIKGFEGGQTPLIKRLAKRGFKCHTSKTYKVINLNMIEELITLNKIPQDKVITKEHLVKANIIKNSQALVKLVSGSNKLERKIELHFDSYSTSAKENIEKAGGRVL